MSLRDQILNSIDLPLHELDVPEWGCKIWIATLTTAERERFEARHVVDKVHWARERLVVATVCDQDRNFLFTEDDIDALSHKNAKACDRIFEAATKANGMMPEDIAELKKSSGTTLSGGSSSNSHSQLESTFAR